MPPRVVRRPAPLPSSASTRISPKQLPSGRWRPALFDLDAHPLEALVEVDAVRAGVEDAARLDVAGGVVLDHLARRRPPAPTRRRAAGCRCETSSAIDGRCRSRWSSGCRAAPPGRNSVHLAVDADASPTATSPARVSVKTKMASEVAGRRPAAGPGCRSRSRSSAVTTPVDAETFWPSSGERCAAPWIVVDRDRLRRRRRRT